MSAYHACRHVVLRIRLDDHQFAAVPAHRVVKCFPIRMAVLESLVYLDLNYELSRIRNRSKERQIYNSTIRRIEIAPIFVQLSIKLDISLSI